MSNRVVHFEIPSEHPEKSISFFKDVFEWEITPFREGEYWLIKTGADDEAGINGGIIKKKDPRQPLATTIQVENLNATVKKIEVAGGKTVTPKMIIPTVGYLIYFQDLDGNIHGLMQRDTSAE